MTDLFTEQQGAPKQWGLTIPGWWPRVEPVFDIGDEIAEELEPAQASEMQAMFSSMNVMDGTRLISVMMTDEEERRPAGIMYINQSEKTGEVMSGLLGIQASPNELPDLRQVGKLKNTTVEVIHFDTVGSVSCVTSQREPSTPEGQPSLIRAYVIPQPQSMQAVLIVYITAYYEHVQDSFAELCDEVTSTFSWRW